MIYKQEVDEEFVERFSKKFLKTKEDKTKFDVLRQQYPKIKGMIKRHGEELKEELHRRHDVEDKLRKQRRKTTSAFLKGTATGATGALGAGYAAKKYLDKKRSSR
jgi:hypothetical protein